jgi:tetratricopeptide (TPR) repeat protein
MSACACPKPAGLVRLSHWSGKERSAMKFTRTASAICSLFLLWTLIGCNRSPEARHSAYLAKGKALVEKQDYLRAILEFRNAAQLKRDDPDTLYELGVAYLGAQDFSAAYQMFKKAVDINPKHLPAQKRLAHLLAQSNNVNDLKEAQSRLKPLLKEARDRDTLNTLAFTELKLGNTKTAEELLDVALTEAPDELASSVLLAQARLAQKDVKGAEAALLKACEAAPKSADAQRNLGEFYISLGRLPEAETKLRRALELAPDQEQALVDFARLQFTLGRKAEAEQHFKRLSASRAYRSIYAVFLLEMGRRDEAIREFESAFASKPDDRGLRTQLVSAYMTVNRPADAKKTLDEALKKNGRDADALLQRAEIALREKNFDRAEADVTSVLKLVPTSGEVHYFLAKIYQASGREPIYRQELSRALELNSGLLAVRIELAQTLMAKEPRAALNLLSEAPEEQRSSTPLLAQKNWALWKMGDLAQMRNGIDAGLSRERSLEFLVQDGLWKLRSNNPKGARTSLEEALRMNPADLRALDALRQSYMAEKNAPLALQKVKEYAAQQPKAAAVQDFLGTLLMASGETKEARTAFMTAKAADPSLLTASLSLVQIDASEGKIEDARKKLVEIVAADRDNLTARRWLGNLELMRGDVNTAIDHFQRVVAADPNDAQASNNLAYLLAEHRNDVESALKYAQKAVEVQPTTPDFCDTLGWVLYRKGIYPTAVKYLEKAGLNSKNAVWKYHLAMAYAKSGDAQKGRSVLNAAMTINPNIPEAKAATALFATVQ